MTPETTSSELMAIGPQFDPETVQRVHEALEKVAEAARAAVEAIAQALAEVLRPVIAELVKIFERLIEALARGIVPGKWLHLAKHAKKARTRKKYQRRIREAVLAYLAAAGEGAGS